MESQSTSPCLKLEQIHYSFSILTGVDLLCSNTLLTSSTTSPALKPTNAELMTCGANAAVALAHSTMLLNRPSPPSRQPSAGTPVSMFKIAQMHDICGIHRSPHWITQARCLNKCLPSVVRHSQA